MMRNRVHVLGMAVGTVGLVGWFWMKAGRETAPSSSASSPEVTELRAEIARLEQRMSMGERATMTLAARSNLGATPAASPADAQRTESPPEQVYAPAVRERPSLPQQLARFEKHFTNLDRLRGAGSDAAMENKVRSLLTDAAAPHLSALPKARLDRVSCGNGFCRLELSFEDPGLTAAAQLEVQIQLASISRGASMYRNAEGSRLHAYVATGDTPLPAFPASEEISHDEGG